MLYPRSNIYYYERETLEVGSLYNPKIRLLVSFSKLDFDVEVELSL